MNIQREADGSLRVELSAGELETFDLNYARLSYQDKNTRQLLHHLFQGASRLTGLDSSPKRMLIEVFPAPRQGCTLYFTPLEKRGKRYRQTAPCVYAFADCDTLLEALNHLNTQPDVQGEVYRLADSFRLIVTHSKGLRLSEYGDRLPATRTHLAYIREHGQRLSR